MATLKDETIQYHRERVRETLVLNPRATIADITKLLETANPPLILGRHYVGKLVRKINTERLVRYDQAHLNRRIAEMQDRTESVITQMWKIVLNPRNSAKERVMAGKVIIDADHDLLQAQMDAGIFTRKLGSIGVDHEHTLKLPDEIRLPILRAFKNYGIIRPQYRILESKPEPVGAGDLGGATSATH